jgi:4-hydroxy-tetrahydrodipicolinate reductase
MAVNAGAILLRRPEFEVFGPYSRTERDLALRSGADVVVIATTSFLKEIADDIRDAIEAGSNVITTAEEAAYPWANDRQVAARLDALARSRGVSILGTGINPGFAFDTLVLTACGVVSEVESLLVERTVDLSGFGDTVLRRIGVAHTPKSFEEGLRTGAITGHIGFPQSMHVVAVGLGVEIERISKEIEPVFAQEDLSTRSLVVRAGHTAGFRQRYVAISGGKPWFEALFVGHVAPRTIDAEPRDSITVNARPPVRISVVPGFDPQSGSSAVVANSIQRVVAARPGWLTVGELPPATPSGASYRANPV